MDANAERFIKNHMSVYESEDKYKNYIMSMSYNYDKNSLFLFIGLNINLE